MVQLCYILLVLITVYVIGISIAIVRRTKSLVLAIPIAVMYFWSIFGAWSFIPLKLSGGSVFYEDMLFAVNIDGNYLMMLFYYSLFIVVFSLFLYSYAKRPSFLNNTSISQYLAYREIIESLAGSMQYNIVLYILLGVFVLSSYQDIIAAMTSNMSAYSLSRFSSTVSNGSLVQFCGDTFTYLAIPILFANKHKLKKNIVIILFSVYFIINFLLGNRNILLCDLVIAALLLSQLRGLKSVLKIKYVIIAIVAFSLIQFISFVRGYSINDVLARQQSFSVGEILLSATQSSEQYAAQMSMYGVEKFEVPITYGNGVSYFISTFIPQFVGLERPERLYHYYIQHTVHNSLDMGVTIHHATAWYLDFGVIGIILGALLWAYVLVYLYRRRSRFLYLYGAIIFSAVSIQMIRDSGIESYKGGLILNTIIPMLVIYFCTKKNYKRA